MGDITDWGVATRTTCQRVLVLTQTAVIYYLTDSGFLHFHIFSGITGSSIKTVSPGSLTPADTLLEIKTQQHFLQYGRAPLAAL